MDKKADVRKIA